MVTRAEYVGALQRERAHVEATSPDDATRLADIDTELARFGTAPAKRGAPEKA